MSNHPIHAPNNTRTKCQRHLEVSPWSTICSIFCFKIKNSIHKKKYKPWGFSRLAFGKTATRWAKWLPAGPYGYALGRTATRWATRLRAGPYGCTLGHAAQGAGHGGPDPQLTHRQSPQLTTTTACDSDRQSKRPRRRGRSMGKKKRQTARAWAHRRCCRASKPM